MKSRAVPKLMEAIVDILSVDDRGTELAQPLLSENVDLGVGVAEESNRPCF